MNTFWNNILKFPRFFISVLMGFFLTIFKPIFESLRSPHKSLILLTILSALFVCIIQILKLMLALN